MHHTGSPTDQLVLNAKGPRVKVITSTYGNSMDFRFFAPHTAFPIWSSQIIPVSALPIEPECRPACWRFRSDGVEIAADDGFQPLERRVVRLHLAPYK